MALKQACLWADSSKLAVALHAARDAGVVGSEVIRGESSLNAAVELRCDRRGAPMQVLVARCTNKRRKQANRLLLSLAGLLAPKDEIDT